MARPEVTSRKICATAERRQRTPQARAPPDAADEVDKPAHNSKTARRNQFSGVQPAAYTIATFCVAHDLSEAMFFKLRNQGRGPREMHVGARVLISHEAAAAWRAEREAETAAAHTAAE